MTRPFTQAPQSPQYQSWSLAEDYSANIHPRWKDLKEIGNELLKNGRYSAAVQAYTQAFAICEGRIAVRAFFDALSEYPESSAAQRLAGMRADVTPIIRHFMRSPDLENGQPNMPAAICAANRAAAYLKLGETSDAVGDAMFAVKLCPEYIKGHHRLKQALIAAVSRRDQLAES